MPDLFFAALLAAVLGQAGATASLLADGDTGWHIRTGEYILATGSVPVRDLFSFSRAGEPWFAWEWGADVLFAKVYAWRGLEGVALSGALVLCLAAAVLFAWLLRRGAGLWVAAGTSLAAASASSVHYLARPHIFTLLLFPAALWILDEDRRRPGARVWCLVPLSAVWTNLHGGFLAWLATLGLLVLVCGVRRQWTALRRYGTLAAACAAATLVNPYGWKLHRHILGYLGSSWILNHVSEFQSPSIRSENMLVFAALLLAAAALAGRRFARGEWFEAALVWIWGFAALRSARHIPLFAAAAAPTMASECAEWWRERAERARARSPARIWWELARDLSGRRAATPWAAVLGALVLWGVPHGEAAAFPAARFPVAAVAQNLERLAPAGGMPRILTSDQWGDYLIFRFYPRARVFFDGRSDFYGPAAGGDYQELLTAGPKWRQALERYRFEAALLPLDWPLGAVLEREPGWDVVYRDRVAVVLVRTALKNPAVTAEWRRRE